MTGGRKRRTRSRTPDSGELTLEGFGVEERAEEEAPGPEDTPAAPLEPPLQATHEPPPAPPDTGSVEEEDLPREAGVEHHPTAPLDPPTQAEPPVSFRESNPGASQATASTTAHPDVAEARSLIREGRISDALTLLRTVVAADPRNVEARFELGMLLDRTGVHAPAVEHFEAALRSVPDSVEILAALGAAYTGLGRFREAEHELRKAERFAPDDLVVRTNLAIVSFRRGLYELAEGELRWVCDRDESNPRAHFYRGEALNRLGRVDDALDAMKTVTRLDPANSRAFYTMGILYDKKHLPTEAAAMYRKARELTPR